MKVVAIVPAKGSSDRVENKNARLLDGKPLVVHTLEKLLRCRTVDEVYLDTESDDLAALAAHLPVRRLTRSPFLATNGTDGHALLLNEVQHIEADIYVQVLCTAPFLGADTIDRAVDVLRTRPEHDSVALVRREKQYEWRDGQPAYGLGRIPNSVDLPAVTIEAMSLYAIRREAALETGRRFGDRVHLMEATPLEAIDVNTPGDFELAGFIASGRRERERTMLRILRSELTSSVLSDILDDLGASTVVRGLPPSTVDAAIVGRASTLKLRPLRDGEDYAGIYRALRSYEQIVPNDVIVVENGLPEYAYFGDLNARLAIRAGAVGAVIDGATRDSSAVRRLGFPVFARGTSCVDVRRRATVDAIGGPVTIGGVRVEPGELVFADGDGVVVIPRALEDQVIGLAVETLSKESRITLEIAKNVPAEDIRRAAGNF